MECENNQNQIEWALVKLTENLDPSDKSGLICHDTATFRQLASSVNLHDLVIEIGCSYGVCTTILKERLSCPSQLLAIDVSDEALDTCRKANP